MKNQPTNKQECWEAATIDLENQNESLLCYQFHTDLFYFTRFPHPWHKHNFKKWETDQN